MKIFDESVATAPGVMIYYAFDSPLFIWIVQSDGVTKTNEGTGIMVRKVEQLPDGSYKSLDETRFVPAEEVDKIGPTTR